MGKTYNNAQPRSTFSKDSSEKKGPSPATVLRAQRAEGASQNAIEGFALFCVANILANLAKLSVYHRNLFAGSYLGLRVLFMILYIITTNKKLSYARTLVFFAMVSECFYVIIRSASHFA